MRSHGRRTATARCCPGAPLRLYYNDVGPGRHVTPKQYASKFWEMDVFIFSEPSGSAANQSPLGGPGSWVRTSVARYRLGAASEGDPKLGHYYFGELGAAVKSQKDIYTRVKRIDGTIESQGFNYSDISYALVAPFYGKGYPEECQLVLQMRYLYQKTNFGLQDFVKKSFIGLDCNGFVGGYLDRRNAPAAWLRTSATKTSTPIKSLLGP